MAQLKEDEWPEDREPTTTEREERIKGTQVPPQQPPADADASLTVPVTNTEPGDAVS